MARTDDFDYPLPGELIATHPPARRTDARMMVVDRVSGMITHRRFADFPDHLRPGDLCVLNDSRVVPSRFFTDDGRVELLRLEEPEPQVWRCLVKPGKRARPGAWLVVAGVAGVVEAVVEEGARRIRWDAPIDPEAHGKLALPPYMEREEEPGDRERYQTVYARAPGSVAAPTAGLHFTPEVLAAVPHAFLTLHVGVGTFRPVKADDPADHEMHEEHFEVTAATAGEVNAARRVVAIGTTTVRVLEHACAADGKLAPGRGSTRIFIRPPHASRRTGALLTNFHLPRSTLLMLVCAFAGREMVLEAYRQAVEARYRFFSYGDCMLLV